MLITIQTRPSVSPAPPSPAAQPRNSGPEARAKYLPPVSTVRRGLKSVLSGLFFLLGAQALCGSAAQAATYTVDRIDDPAVTAATSACSAAANDCSLRGALTASNATAGVADTIDFATPLFSSAQSIVLGGTELPIADGVTITGPGARLLTIDGNTTSRVFNSTAPASQAVALSDVTVTRGNASGEGGGLYQGSGTAPVTISRCTFTGNHCTTYGGALKNFATMIVRDCALTTNVADSYGGAIETESSSASLLGVLTMINCTISGNTSPRGGGISNFTNNTTLLSCTIAGNTSTGAVGGGVAYNDPTIRNSIIALNTSAGTSPDIDSKVVSQGYNLIGNVGTATGFTATGDQAGTAAAPIDPKIGPLAFNGGPTQTRALLAGSTAINAGNAGVAADQRGVARPQGTADDIGAFELDAGVSSIRRADINPTAAASVSFTVTFTSPVTGVDASDFTLTTTGTIAGASIVSVTPSVATSSSTFTVVVNTGSGDGTIRLNVVDDDSITTTSGTPLGGVGAGNGNFSTGEAYTVQKTIATTGALISEFRLRGTNGALDEYIEIANATNAPLNLTGWQVAYETAPGASTSLNIPAGTVLPARGHYLFANSGYSLGAAATPDMAMTIDAIDNGAIRLDNNGFAAAPYKDEVDFVGSGFPSNEPPALPSGPTAPGNYAFVRKVNLSTLLLQDTNNNTADFSFVSPAASATAGSVAGTGGALSPTLGAPGPESLASLVQRPLIRVSVLFGTMANATQAPNRVRVPGNQGANQPNGYILMRRKITNTTNAPITSLRFRAVRITTLTAPPVSGQADVRLLSSADETFTFNNVVYKVKGTTLEQPTGLAQSQGGGLNSSVIPAVNTGTLTLSTPLAAGQSLNYSFKLGVVTTGSFNVVFTLEALPITEN